MKAFMGSFGLVGLFVSMTSAATLPLPDNKSSQEVRFGNFDVSLYAVSRPESSHEHQNDDGTVWNHILPPSANVDLNVYVDQHAFGNFIVPFGNDSTIRSRKDGVLEGRSNFYFLFWDDEVDYVLEPESSVSFQFGRGPDLWSNTRSGHSMHWQYDEEKDEYTSVLTDNIQSSYSFLMDDAEVLSAEIEVSDHTIRSNDTTYPGIRIGLRFTAQYVGESEYFDLLFPFDSPVASSGGSGGGGGSIGGVIYDANMNPVISVPEPASFVLASLAVCLMFGASLYELRSRR